MKHGPGFLVAKPGWSKWRNRLSDVELGRFFNLRLEGTMYATIRRYTTKSGINQKTIDEFKGRLERYFLPTLQDIRGFHGYYVVTAGNKELVSISIFEDRNGTQESTPNRRA